MQLIFIGKKKIYKKVLPEKPERNEYISGKNKKIFLNINVEKDNWVIYSNNSVKIMDITDVDADVSTNEVFKLKNKVKRNTVLEENKVYAVKYAKNKEIYLLYCLPTYEENWQEFSLKQNKEISIGKNKSSHICYKNSFIKLNHAKIFLEKGKWYVKNNNIEYPIFVSDRSVRKNKVVINNGEIVFIMGLKIVLIGNKLFMNNPFNQIEYDENVLIKRIVGVPKIEKENLEDENISLQKEYFYSAPRIIRTIQKASMNIEAPPPPQSQEKLPFILTLGSGLSMGVMLLAYTASTLRGIFNGTSSLIDILISILYILVMILGMLIIPLLTKRWEKSRTKEYEIKRKKKYRAYLLKKVKSVDNIKRLQQNILEENNLSTEECENIIINKKTRLWERTIKDEDFLSITLGRGRMPLELDISYSEKEFSLEDEDDLEKMVNEFTRSARMLDDVPIGYQLTKNKICALIANENDTKDFMRNMIIQLMALQNYRELKLIFLLEDKSKFTYVKSLPYVWNDTNNFRFFAEDESEIEQISRYLEEQFNNRIENENLSKRDKYEAPYYLIITDNFRKIENFKIVNKILENDKNKGFSIFCLSNNFKDVTNECKTFINIENNKGKFFESDLSNSEQLNFEVSRGSEKSLEEIINTVSNLSIKSKVDLVSSLPNSYTFLDMFGVGNIKQLKILDRWNTNDSTKTLSAPIGINGFGKMILLDAHEKAHGPHGLIGGTTGSGKSEFIITYILSMAINYHPDDVNFILIDYKGGGLAGAFYKGKYKLPHIVGTITNIDTVEIQRSLASINSELRRRQILFNEARNKTSEGTIDIYKYQKLYHSGVVDKPIPHLFIVCDEFAELKQQQSEFMSELISVSRIGRSLGVHLILATQKPGGVVDDQIRSNSKFAVCLKVQDRGDSSDLLGTPDAAYLKQAGRFYLKVGNDEIFELGQSGWSGATYYESESGNKNLETAVKFISNIGKVIKEANDKSKKIAKDKGEQLTNLVKYISNLAEKENIKTENLWLDAIPETIYLKDIKEKYQIKPKKNNIVVTLGEYDEPENQRQDAVQLNLSKVGNTIIFGSSDSGKETLASTIIYDLMKNYTANEVWAYILDFGTEALKIYSKAPIVGDMMFINDAEKIIRFLEMLSNELRERKEILSDYNGDYQFYLKSTGKFMPMITVILNGYETFNENYNNDQIDDILLNLTREGTKYGIVFIYITNTSNDLRYRMNQNFKQKIALKQNDVSDYAGIFNVGAKKRPSALFGRGLIEIDENIYEFQTAKICKAEDYNIFIKNEIEKLSKEEKAPSVKILPAKLKIEDVKPQLKTISKLPIGLKKNDLSLVTMNFKNSLLSAIVSKKSENAIQFAYNLAEEIKFIEKEQIKVIILDAEKQIENGENTCEKNLYNLLEDLNNENKEYHTICILTGIEKLLNYLGNVNEDGVSGDEFLANLMSWAKDKQGFSFIVADNEATLKNHNYDNWYNDNINSENIIWVGNGIEDQFMITCNATRNNIVNDCDCSFGYININEKTIMIKLLEMKEMSENDE